VSEQTKPPKVVHCKWEPFDVYIGRPSKWGNPFRIGVRLERDDAIALYRAYMSGDPQGRLLAEQAKRELRGKTLGCWCAPKACHGDVLLEIANAE
jgi:hypothetical protein